METYEQYQPLYKHSLGLLPVGIQDDGSMSSEQRQLLRQSPLLVDRYDGECASSTGFPIDGNILRVRLCIVRPTRQWSSACVLPLQGSYPMHFSRPVYCRSIVPGHKFSARSRPLLWELAVVPSLLAGRRHALRQMLAHGVHAGRKAQDAYDTSTSAQNGLTLVRMHRLVNGYQWLNSSCSRFTYLVLCRGWQGTGKKGRIRIAHAKTSRRSAEAVGCRF